MLLVVDDKFGEVLIEKMPNWYKLENIINNSELKTNQIMILAHHSVRMELEAAYMHMSMLGQSYSNVRQTTNARLGPIQIQSLKRTMFDNVIFNLSSLLDSISHEINQVYQFGISFKRTQIDHQGNDGFCVRCKLNTVGDDLASYLNWELPRLGQNPNIDNNSWYKNFSEYRNHVMHRTILFLHQMPGVSFLPDDPTIRDSQGLLFNENGKPIFNRDVPVMKNVIYQRELRIYSLECFERIALITEKIYDYLIAKKHQKS